MPPSHPQDTRAIQRVLVTGGAGFIGSHLVEALLHRGCDVVVLDDFSSGLRANVPAHHRLTLLEGSVTDPHAVRQALADVDAVVHLAAIASVTTSVDRPLDTHHANLYGTLVVLDAAKHEGVERVVYASSAAVYGKPQTLPLREGDASHALSPYAVEKRSAEHYLSYFHATGAFQGIALRLFNVFGPRQNPSSPYAGVISRFGKNVLRGAPVEIFGTGEQTRDFVYVEDVVRIMVAALEWASDPEPPIVNVGRGKAVDLLALLDIMERLQGTTIERHYYGARTGDILHSVCDNARLLSIMPDLEFTALPVALERTLAWLADYEHPEGHAERSTVDTAS